MDPPAPPTPSLLVAVVSLVVLPVTPEPVVDMPRAPVEDTLVVELVLPTTAEVALVVVPLGPLADELEALLEKPDVLPEELDVLDEPDVLVRVVVSFLAGAGSPPPVPHAAMNTAMQEKLAARPRGILTMAGQGDPSAK